MYRFMIYLQTVWVPLLGPPGVFLAAVIDSSVLSLPQLNDLLVVTAAAAEPRWAWTYAVAATLGSLVGCALTWWAGRRGGEFLLARRLRPEKLARLRLLFDRWGALALAGPAMLPPPMPFKIFVLAAGAFGFSLRRSLVALFFGRAVRYGGLAWLGVAYGGEASVLLQQADDWFEPRLLPLALVATLLLVATWLLRRRRQAPTSVSDDLV